MNKSKDARIRAIFNLFALMLFTNSISASAGTDMRCLNDCQNRGYIYQDCLRHCSINNERSRGGYWSGYLEGKEAIKNMELQEQRKQQLQLQNEQIELKNKIMRETLDACKSGNKHACDLLGNTLR